METLKRSRENLNSPIKNNANKKVKSVSVENLEDYNCFFNDDDDDFDLMGAFDDGKEKENIIPNGEDYKLDLSAWKRCFVERIERDAKNFDLIIYVREERDGHLKGKCRLQGPWCHTKVTIDECISVITIWDSKTESFVVNADFGFIVTNPDTLISGTSVVGSLFCRRKGVLQDRFRGLDSDKNVMVIGSIVHELLQVVLTKELKTSPEIYKASADLLKSPSMMYTLFASKLSLEEARSELMKFVPNVINFVEQYMESNSTIGIQKGMFQGKIDRIQDIEENLWIPQLGLKGKVDVSVNVRRRTEKLFMPLELKTGRASFSSEHKGQVILYQMMLNEIGKSTSAGLLLYLREGMMKEIPATRHEQRDLIILRNDLAYYLTRDVAISESGEMASVELPEPVNHHSACGKCAYNTICTSFLKNDQSFEFSDRHPLKSVSKEVTSHLNESHLAYFIKWCGLLSLEEQEAKKSNQLRSIWSDTVEQRQKKRRAVANLSIAGNVVYSEGRFMHQFEVKHEGGASQKDLLSDLTLFGISIGEYVVISTPKRIAIAAGHIYDLTKFSISISLERDLKKIYPDEKFIIDKHDSSSGNVFNYTNLGVMLDNSEISNKLRSIVMDKEPPTFVNVLPKVIANEGIDVLVGLNSIQRKAVAKALTTNDYMLIKGLPGTGKTQTLVAIIRLLNMMGKSVLITSHTHSAVDNLLLRLKPHNLKFLRIGSTSRINPNLKEFSEKKATAECSSPEELDEIYSSYNIVGVTCLGSSHSIFVHRKFDVCIVDEATQVFQPTVLRPLLYASRFILVGDPDQLPPLVKSQQARRLGADESLFHRLDSPEATSVLTLQYRMNKTITKLANDITYEGSLQCANDNIKMSSLCIPDKEKLPTQKWLNRALEKHIDQAVCLLDTLDCLNRTSEFAESRKSDPSIVLEQTYTENDLNSHEEPKKQSVFKYTNYCEAAVCFTLVKSLLLTGYSAENIGIIAPYRAQVELLRKLSEDFEKFFKDKINFSGLEVNTVDQYQGRDKEVIIYCCTKTGSISDKSKDGQILEDKRRLTVAITRSKHKLIVIGDSKCLNSYTPFREMFSKIPSRCKVVLEDARLGFSWEEVLADLNCVMD